MTNAKIKKLKAKYEATCMEWVQLFCEKQDLEFDGWVGNEVGGIAGFASQYFFNLSDIIFDLNSNQFKGLILRWQNDAVDFNMFKETPKYINYKSYTMGLRYDQLTEQQK
jgi:hypothetical protein